MKPFMKKELAEKVINSISDIKFTYLGSVYKSNYILFQLHYHSVDSETIFDYIPKEILPNEIGGFEKSVKDINGGYQLIHN